MTDILNEGEPNPRLERIVQKVLKESELYTNTTSLDPDERNKIKGAIGEIARIITELSPNIDDSTLTNATADVFFQTVHLKQTIKGKPKSSNLQ